MTKFDTHLCLVSAQATPNLLPLIDDAWRPRRVVLACSSEMKERGQLLKNVIQTRGGGIEVIILDLPHAYDYNALSEAFLNYLAEHADDDIALNVTGGTKLMAVAAQEVFRSAGKSVFYVNVETDDVLTIGNQGKTQPLRAKLKVHEILKVHGHSVTSQTKPQITAALRDLTEKLVARVESFGSALGVFNALANKAFKSRLEVVLNASQLNDFNLRAIIDLFEQEHLLSWSNSNTFVFRDESARFFANGGWLETYVYQAVKSLQLQPDSISDVVQSLGVGVNVPTQNKHISAIGNDANEVDVAFLHLNTLYLIECKTANLANLGTTGESKATEAIYKMESLLKLGGLRTRGMIVDYRGELSRSKANQERARTTGIKIVSGLQLTNLQSNIQQWVSPRKAGSSA